MSKTKTDLTRQILTTIQKKHLTSKPKYYFYLSSLLFGLSLAATILLTVFFFNLFTFHLANPSPPPFMFIRRPLPVLFFILAVFTLAISVAMLKKNHYRHSLIAIFLGALTFVLFGHFLLNRFQPAHRFPVPLRRFYQQQHLPNRLPNFPRRFLNYRTPGVR